MAANGAVPMPGRMPGYDSGPHGGRTLYGNTSHEKTLHSKTFDGKTRYRKKGADGVCGARRSEVSA
jgi:hypothetical protein